MKTVGTRSQVGLFLPENAFWNSFLFTVNGIQNRHLSYPAYSHQKRLRYTLNSVLLQSIPEWQNNYV